MTHARQRSPIHWADAFSGNGEVTAACGPRHVSRSREGWTIIAHHVTCKPCQAALRERAALKRERRA